MTKDEIDTTINHLRLAAECVDAADAMRDILQNLIQDTLREAAAAVLWPLSEKDATHAVDDYRRGRLMPSLRRRKMKRALYFGYLDGAGHFLHGLRSRYGEPQKECPSFPWGLEHLDTGLLKNGKIPDTPDGRVHWTPLMGACTGPAGAETRLWHAFFWWDRSGDKRSNSNSGFYVEGFALEQRDEAFAFACAEWPEVVTRQHHPLVLVP